MSNNRTQILNMLAQGKISVDQAEKLLNALNEEPDNNTDSGKKVGSSSKNPKYLRVLVNSVKEGSDTPETVNVKIPLQLLRAGIKLKSILPNQAGDKISDAINEHGMNINLDDITPENIEELIRGLNDFTIDVKNGKETVKVFVE